MLYTQEDLEKAEKSLEIAEKAADNYSGNNPGRYDRLRKNEISARDKVSLITEKLELQKDPEYVETELAFEALNELYPDIKSKSIVEYNGKRYQCRFHFIGKFAGKKEFSKYWIVVK